MWLLCDKKSSALKLELWGSHSSLLQWETRRFLFVLASFIQMFLISHIQIDSICKALLAALADKGWQNLGIF